MVAATRKSEPAKPSSPPPDSEETGFVAVPEVNSMSPLVSKLSELRDKYLSELETAREKVKKNFLK